MVITNATKGTLETTADNKVFTMDVTPAATGDVEIEIPARSVEATDSEGVSVNLAAIGVIDRTAPEITSVSVTLTGTVPEGATAIAVANQVAAITEGQWTVTVTLPANATELEVEATDGERTSTIMVPITQFTEMMVTPN